MKIYYISHSRIPSRFANSVHVMRMCQAFSNNGHDVTLFAKEGSTDAIQNHKSDYEIYGVEPNFDIEKIETMSNPWLAKIDYVYQLEKRISNGEMPDLFYCRHMYGAYALRKLGVPVIFEAHQTPNSILEGMVQRRLFQHENFQYLVAISRNLAERYQHIFKNFGTGDIVVAHDCADPVDSREVPIMDAPWPGRLARTQVGYIGQLYKGRGVDLIIRIAQELESHDFHIIGGSEEDIRHWKGVAINLPNLHFHGYIENALGNAYRAKMDILLAPYQKKVAAGGNKGDISAYLSPMKLFEYMASGRAIIASNTSAISEILEDHHDALLVQADDDHEWISAILKLEDTELRQTLGQNARDKLESQYTWKKRAIDVLKGMHDAK